MSYSNKYPLPPTLMQATHNLYKYHRRHTHTHRVYKNRKTTCRRGKGAWQEWKADKRIVERGYDHNISPMYEIVREMQLLKFPQKKKKKPLFLKSRQELSSKLSTSYVQKARNSHQRYTNTSHSLPSSEADPLWMV